MYLDKIEIFLEEILSCLKARKEIAPLKEKNSELEIKNSELEKSITALIDEKDLLIKKVEELINQRDDFKSQLDGAQGKFELKEKNLRGEFNFKIEQANKKISELDKARLISEGKLNFYRDTYGELDAAYKIYLTLDEETRFDLAGIFGAGETAAGFFSGAVQEKNLEPFWDYVSRHADNENLNCLFDFCFEMFNRGFREPPYIRLNVERGEFFDSDNMRRALQSRQMGNVIRVILQGYKYSAGNVVKKSVVELG